MNAPHQPSSGSVIDDQGAGNDPDGGGDTATAGTATTDAPTTDTDTDTDTDTVTDTATTDAPATDTATDAPSPAAPSPAAPSIAVPGPAAGTIPSDGDGDADGDADGAPTGDELLVQEGDVAGDYLERLLDILDMDGDIDLDVEGDRASVAVVGGKLTTLIGPDGAVLEALQELTRLAVAQSTGTRSRLMLDVGGYRAKRRADLSALASETARRVAESRQPERLSPMNPFERKVVHDVVAGVSGVHSESEGEDPHRRVVVLPDA